MLEQVHDHIDKELGHRSRSDTSFVVTSVLSKLNVPGSNSGVAISDAEEGSTISNNLVLVVFFVMTLFLIYLSDSVSTGKTHTGSPSTRINHRLSQKREGIVFYYQPFRHFKKEMTH